MPFVVGGHSLLPELVAVCSGGAASGIESGAEVLGADFDGSLADAQLSLTKNRRKSLAHGLHIRGLASPPPATRCAQNETVSLEAFTHDEKLTSPPLQEDMLTIPCLGQGLEACGASLAQSTACKTALSLIGYS